MTPRELILDPEDAAERIPPRGDQLRFENLITVFSGIQLQIMKYRFYHKRAMFGDESFCGAQIFSRSVSLLWLGVSSVGQTLHFLLEMS